jgi:hypothetical protein
MGVTTLEIAGYAAVTGTAGLAVSLLGRRDSVWSKRAKVCQEVRRPLQQLRDAASAAQTKGGSALQTPRARADLDEVDELAGRAADRRLRKALRAARHEVAVAASGGTGTYSESASIARAIASINSALARADKIERKAPK